MTVPNDTLISILGYAYYLVPDRREDYPDYDVLAACALVHSSWTPIAQELLFRYVSPAHIYKLYEALLDPTRDVTRLQELYAHVRILQVGLQKDHDNDELFLAPTEFSMLLSRCTNTYELVIYGSNNIFVLDPSCKSTIQSSGHSIRSLNFLGCNNSRSPLLFEILNLLPTIQFLYINRRSVADPPTQPLEGIHLYQLSLDCMPRIETLKWLMALSSHSLRVLEFPSHGDDLETKTLLRDRFASNLYSLRLPHADEGILSFFLPACTQLKELVCLRLPTETRLERFLPVTVESLTISDCSNHFNTIVTIIQTRPHVRTLRMSGNIPEASLKMLRDLCMSNSTHLLTDLAPKWETEDHVIPSAEFNRRRRRSITNFRLMERQ